jgi:hypothetical protein
MTFVALFREPFKTVFSNAVREQGTSIPLLTRVEVAL